MNQQPQGVGTVRIFWIIWCCFWALGWLLIGFFTFLFGWLMVPLALLAILLPVGKPSQSKAIYFPQAPQPAMPPGIQSLRPPPPAGPPPGWYSDPSGSGDQRYWNGQAWQGYDPHKVETRS
jgi:hypothetical protein